MGLGEVMVGVGYEVETLIIDFSSFQTKETTLNFPQYAKCPPIKIVSFTEGVVKDLSILLHFSLLIDILWHIHNSSENPNQIIEGIFNVSFDIDMRTSDIQNSMWHDLCLVRRVFSLLHSFGCLFKQRILTTFIFLRI